MLRGPLLVSYFAYHIHKADIKAEVAGGVNLEGEKKSLRSLQLYTCQVKGQNQYASGHSEALQHLSVSLLLKLFENALQ